MSEEVTTSEAEATGAVEGTEEDVSSEQAEKTWRDALPDNLKGIKTLEKFKDVSGLAKSYVETEKYFEGAIRIPGENASKEEVDAYYAKLGRPESIDGYELDPPELPDGMQIDEQFQNAFLTKAHASGLNTTQVKELYDWYNGITKDVHVQNTVQKENSIQKAEIELRSEWGRQYDEKLSGVQRLVDQYASEADKEYLNQGAGNDPHLARMLDRIAKDFGEAKHLGDPKVNAFTDPASAKQAKDAFYRDTQSDDYKAYFDNKHPRHKDVAKMISRWNETITGGE
jgi:hypothetical protein